MATNANGTATGFFKNAEIIAMFLEGNENMLPLYENDKLHLIDGNTLIYYDTHIAEKKDHVIYITKSTTPDDFAHRYTGTDTRRRASAATNGMLNDIREKGNSKYTIVEVPFREGYKESLIPDLQQTNNNSQNKNVEQSLPMNCYYRNIMISGTPGCGKSHFVDKYAIPEIIGEGNDQHYKKHVTRVVFTEGYTYEDFFGCYKPCSTQDRITYAFSEGPFCKAVCNALQHPNQNFVLVIEEMNRGNAYEIFGSLFQLLDRNEGIPNAIEGQSTYSIKLSNDASSWFKNHIPNMENDLYIPQNLYIIGTVNNSDSRVQFMDTAMKRRFHAAFVDEEGVLYGTSRIPGLLKFQENSTVRCTANAIKAEKYEVIRKEINRLLIEDNQLEDKLIAKYFVKMDHNNEINEIDFITNVLGYLIQNVYRGRDLPADIFANPDIRSVGQLLKKYFDKDNLEGILSAQILDLTQTAGNSPSSPKN